MKRLITVTRQDLSSGYQTVQSAHAVADFAFRKPFQFIMWKLCGNYLISLTVKDKQTLEELMITLDNHKVKYVSFYETDVNEITAIAICPSKEADRLTSSIPLANRKVGKLDKNFSK